ncbi:MAG: hypothetical protein ACRDNO_16235 [Trebonia sp.]
MIIVMAMKISPSAIAASETWLADEERDDDGRGDDGPQQAHAADLTGRAQVAGEHCRQDDAG